MNYPRVSIIILNWNGWRDTVECLESLYRITYPNYDVIVVDNGSRDESIQKIKEYAKGEIKVNSKFFKYNPKNKPIEVFEVGEDEAKEGKFNRPLYEKLDPDRRMILIKNKDNYGFAGGNNVGIKFALSVLNPDYVLLLNNDTVGDPDFLTELVKVAESDEKIGIVGPKVYFYDYNSRNDVIQWGKTILIRQLGILWNPNRGRIDNFSKIQPQHVNYLYGACIMLRKDVIYETGMFDDDFFLYWEEVELYNRVKHRGYILVYTPKAKIWHKLSNSKSKHRRVSPIAVYYFARNMYLFAKRSLNTFDLLVFLLFLHLIKVPFLVMVYLFHYRNLPATKMFINGMLDGASLLLNKDR